jgi:hypothetical protein
MVDEKALKEADQSSEVKRVLSNLTPTYKED